MTLKDLAHTRDYLNLTAISRALGQHPSALHKRIERGGPELTEQEEERIAALLRPIIARLSPASARF